MNARSHVCYLLLTAVIATATTQASMAANISASSSGYGLWADIDALGLGLSAGPLPVGVSGIAPAPYNDVGSVLNVSVDSDIPLVVEGEIGAAVVNASAFSNVDGLAGSRTTSATGGVVGAGLDVATIPFLGGGINLLGLDGTLSSSAQITGDYGSFVATGNTTIESLALTINGINVNLAAFVGVNVAPNTSVNLGVLGILNSTLILNEQIIAGDNSSIEVNAFHLSVNLGNLITTEVILGHSQAQMAAVPEPAAATLLSLGMLGFTQVRRRRR